MENALKLAFTKLQNGNDVRGAAIATETEKQTLTADLVTYIAAGFGQFIAEKTGKAPADIRIGIGHDSRVTADLLRDASVKGLGAVHVYDCGLVSTPAMFQSTVLAGAEFDGAIMITASHLPFNRNGQKFFTREGGLDHDQMSAVLNIAAELADKDGALKEDGTISAADYKACGGACEPFDLVSLYCAQMQKIIKEEVNAEDYEHPLKGLHIVVDAGNGASGFFTSGILEPLGADTSGSVFLDPDGTFPNHVPNPENPVAMKAICKATLDAKADLGVIFDCDGDRGAVVFADGTEVNRNTLIALLAAIVSEKKPGSTVVTDSVTSDELKIFLEEKLGMKHLRYQRGYKNVINKGIELNANGEECELAIETSGHGAFKENYFSDDGAYIAVKIICQMAKLRRQGINIESLIADLGEPKEAKEIRLTIHEDDFKAYGQKVLAAFRKLAEEDPRFHIVEPNYEGIRVSFDDEEVKGWILVRMSLHDPVIPINAEAREEGGVEVILGRVLPLFDSFDKLSK